MTIPHGTSSPESAPHGRRPEARRLAPAAAHRAAPAPRVPAADAMWRWLRGDDVVMPDGGVRSWSNAAQPGYRYPEAAGLHLSLGCQLAPATDPQLRSIVDGLAVQLSASGGVGRGEHRYLFDTAIALSAVLAWRRVGGALRDATLPQQLFGFVRRLATERRATEVPDAAEPDRWSLAYGCHHLKVALAVNAYADHFRDAGCDALIDRLCDDLLTLCQGGRFTIHARSAETYVHSHCYAVEGLINVTEHGRHDFTAAIRDCAAWLLGCQTPSGGLHARHDGGGPYGDLHADATAQAVRIWSWADPVRYGEATARALAFLASLQCPAGGIYYRPGSDHVNTWATIFAYQAVGWSCGRFPPTLI